MKENEKLNQKQNQKLKKANEPDFKTELKILAEPLRTIKVGWFGKLNQKQITALETILSYNNKKEVNLNCYNCIKDGLIYINERFK